jgi:hypothetical protein
MTAITAAAILPATIFMRQRLVARPVTFVALVVWQLRKQSMVKV